MAPGRQGEARGELRVWGVVGRVRGGCRAAEVAEGRQDTGEGGWSVRLPSSPVLLGLHGNPGWPQDSVWRHFLGVQSQSLK